MGGLACRPPALWCLLQRSLDAVGTTPSNHENASTPSCSTSRKPVSPSSRCLGLSGFSSSEYAAAKPFAGARSPARLHLLSFPRLREVE